MDVSAWAPSIEKAKPRVAERVRHGGHDIPPADIERRFACSLSNLLDDYASLVDQAGCLFNSGETPAMFDMLETWRRK